MVTKTYDINHYALYMFNFIHLQATTLVQTISTPMADFGSTFGMYKPFLTVTLSYYY